MAVTLQDKALRWLYFSTVNAFVSGQRDAKVRHKSAHRIDGFSRTEERSTSHISGMLIITKWRKPRSNLQCIITHYYCCYLVMSTVTVIRSTGAQRNSFV
jgi:hypothetical protein